MIIAPAESSNKFLYKFLPKQLYLHILQDMDKYKLDALDKYIKSLDVDLNCLQLIKLAVNNLIGKTVGNKIVLEVSDKILLGNYTLQQLIKVIDFGNTEVRGTKLFKNACDYINSHMVNMIERYLNR